MTDRQALLKIREELTKSFSPLTNTVQQFGTITANAFEILDKHLIDNTINSFQGEHRFLSNFYPSLIRFCGIPFLTVEHAYQAAKTLDDQERFYISQLPTAKEAKQAGQKVTLREDWQTVRLEIMFNLLTSKFEIKELADKLKATGDKYLIEGNYWHDTFWGVCDGKGENHLGRLLMEIRKKL